MANELRFDGRVAIVTGAGNGLGRTHALLLASRGAKVVVNDLGGGRHGGGTSSEAADKVVAEIKAAGGEAVANYDSVENGGKIVQSAIDAFGRIDIVVNNAGILRDVTFHKMTEEDWELIYRVHVLGSFRVTHAAWPHMRDQGYGRILFTSSAAGIYGNFGQANYAMAKLGLVGLSSTLALEGKKKNVLVNTIAPLAGSRLTETVLPKELIDALRPEYVSPLVAYLCHESSTETGGLFEVGGGFFAKLRWERAEGKTVRLGREIKLEDIQKSWGAIAGFDKTTHPAEINQSMGPVMANVQAGPAKGGNDLIDVDQALGYEYPAVHSSYDERDLSIYALGVGAAENPLDDKELRYVYELHGQGFAPLPTYGVVPALKALMDLAKQGKTAPGMNYGLDRLLHGEQYLELTRPLPAHAKLTHKAKVKEIWDKGKNALIVTEIRCTDESGEEIVRNESTAVIRGAGGWGGERGPSSDINVPPERAADATIEQKIPENQALLYRLSGDWNPLHADPSFATAFGFSKPILHGLCTFGYAARHVIHSFAGGDARKFKSIKVRFADSVFPGETVVTEMWKENDERIVFRCKVKERDKVVISNAAITLWKEIPQPKAKPAAPAAAAAPAKAAEDPAGDVFIGIRDYVEKNPAVVEKVKTIFQFELKGPDATWTIDLKNGKGAVFPGAGADKADTVLEIASSDWLAMATGQADPQKLYFEGKLKISGNVMASQKLGFMKKIDPEQAKAAIAAHKAKAASGEVKAAAAPQAAAAPKGPGAAAVFDALKERLAKSPELAKEVDTIIEFRLTEGDWHVDFTGGKTTVAMGRATNPAAVLTLSTEDLVAFVSGKEQDARLFQTGRLRVDGDVRVASNRLHFLKGLLG